MSKIQNTRRDELVVKWDSQKLRVPWLPFSDPWLGRDGSQAFILRCKNEENKWKINLWCDLILSWHLSAETSFWPTSFQFKNFARMSGSCLKKNIYETEKASWCEARRATPPSSGCPVVMPHRHFLKMLYNGDEFPVGQSAVHLLETKNPVSDCCQK